MKYRIINWVKGKPVTELISFMKVKVFLQGAEEISVTSHYTVEVYHRIEDPSLENTAFEKLGSVNGHKLLTDAKRGKPLTFEVE